MPILDFEDSQPKGTSTRKPIKLFLGTGVLIGGLALGSTFAANINLNGDSNVEFGQGFVATTACDNDILITPTSGYVNASGEGSFKFTGITLNNLDTRSEGCAGKSLQLDAYDLSGSSLATFSITISSDGAFSSEDGDLSNEGVQGSASYVTFTFSSPTLDATSVYKITIQSESSAQSIASYSVGDTGPGGGIIFYVNNSPNGFDEAGAACSPNCHYLEWAPASWAANDYKEYEFSNNSNFYGGGTGTALGTGYNNTLLLATANVSTGWTVEANEVASYVRAYGGGGLSDWFIPSRDEIYLISNSTQFSSGGFTHDVYYWSSTANENGPGTSLQLHVMSNPDGTGDPGLQPVYRKFPVRPIRAF
jgi:hypothetical protein